MKFDELDAKMRVYETAHDHCVMPEMYMVARLDGKGFTKFTKDKMQYERPYDLSFRNAMVATACHLMTNTGFKFNFGYTQSDEISLLFALDDNTFSRKERKLNSVLAGEASVYFSRAVNEHAVFDCRIVQLPVQFLVIDYFRWRIEDATRNCLNSWAYWTLRDVEKKSPRAAATQLLGQSRGFKNELLFQHDINFNELPEWQRRGVGVHWETYLKESYNPIKKETVNAIRRRLNVDYNLPMDETALTRTLEFYSFA